MQGMHLQQHLYRSVAGIYTGFQKQSGFISHKTGGLMLRFTDNVIAQMTRECNCHCTYCYEHGLDDSYWKGKRFTVESFKQAFDTYIYYRCILGRIENHCDWHFHGGEVLLLPFSELKQMFEYPCVGPLCRWVAMLSYATCG